MKIPFTPPERLSLLNDFPINPNGSWVLYWMTAARRTQWNFALQEALYWGQQLQKPVVILEALRWGYPWASERLHGFIIQGMIDNQQALQGKPVYYYPYIEPSPNAGKGLLAAWAAQACVVIGDHYPCFMLPAMHRAAAKQMKVQLRQVDSNGLLPVVIPTQSFLTAYAFRRYLQKTLPPFLSECPLANALDNVSLPMLLDLPENIAKAWPMALLKDWQKHLPAHLSKLVLPNQVPLAPLIGGAKAAEQRLQQFLQTRLSHYALERNQLCPEISSGLSPYLHFGHISIHEIFTSLAQIEQWTPAHLGSKCHGKKSGWWGMSANAEAFLDECITWRELGFNMCQQHPHTYDQYISLPAWAQQTLANHAGDVRPWLYSLAQLESAQTHDVLWNATQNQLRQEGKIHNYLRMLWGKKILEWSASPEEALAVMLHLNNAYALDGRDPNSYSGIFWVLGRYDRPWGPERPIFGKIRYMSTDNTRRKLDVSTYLQSYGQIR